MIVRGIEEMANLKKVALLQIIFWTFAWSKKCAVQNHVVRFHTPRSGNDNMFCNSYKKETCCTPETDRKIKAGGERLIDGTKWNVCGALSTECSKYHHLETCRYECSPDLGDFIVKGKHGSDAFLKIPICASFCDSWYEACKDDLVCGKNWDKDFRWDKDGNHCVHPCKSYKEYYGSGRELCNNMWGNAMFYSTDKSKCV